MRNFELEVFFSEWEFNAKHHMTASDVESLSVSTLMQLAQPEERAAIDKLWLGYTETWGHPALREAIAATYENQTSSDILCLAGAGEGLYAIARVLLSANDHVIVPTPNYQSAETVPLTICDVTGVKMDYHNAAGATQGWNLDIEKVFDATKPNTKLISLNFPHNPTGYLPDRSDLDALVAHCDKRGIYLLCDEVYRGIELNTSDRLPQIADIYDRGLSLNVMSKAYGLPGLRIGWVASQAADILQQIERYKHYLSICNSAPAEILALIALNNREKILERNQSLVKRNVVQLESLFAEFSSLFEWQRPKGGCVAYPRYLGTDGVEVFCKRLIEESGVLLLPSSIYRSELVDAPTEHFRVGFGRDAVFRNGLAAFKAHLSQHYSDNQ